MAFKRTTQVDNFIKSSIADFNDPVFLTFHVDFFPVRQTFQNDGLANDSLLMGPAGLFEGHSGIGSDRYSRNSQLNNNNSYVEYAAYDWLGDYYSGVRMPSVAGGETPQVALGQFIVGLLDLQASPWYFQSVQGISDLWKTSHRIKEGNKKATLTFNCLESIRQPLTKIAQNYRYAVYDDYRMSYRLPDNLRWFDMEISLIEIRNIVDHGAKGLFSNTDNDFYQYDSDDQLVGGLHMVKFRLKMCEFDFSDFLGGAGQTEFKASTEEKPFSPSFKVNVGWVEQQAVPVSEADDIHKVGLFSGVFNALNNRLSNVISSVARLPGSIAGSIMNEIQTKVENGALGNVYDEGGLNGISGAINKFGAAITGRQAPVGPDIVSRLDTDATPPPEQAPIVLGNVGFAFEKPDPEPPITDLGDVYP